jgi:hypothetical protein
VLSKGTVTTMANDKDKAPDNEPAEQQGMVIPWVIQPPVTEDGE